MAVSRLFLYIQLSPVVPVAYCMACAGFGLCYERNQLCVMWGFSASVMCGLESVSCAGFGLCYVGI